MASERWVSSPADGFTPGVLWRTKALACALSRLHVGLNAQPFHALHVALHGAAAGDLLGTGLREPALLAVPKAFTQVPA